MIFGAINGLIEYAVKNNLISDCDRIWARNTLCDVLRIDEFRDEKPYDNDLTSLLSDIISYASDKGIFDDTGIVSRDLFDTKIMGLLTPPPHEVISEFNRRYLSSPKEATEYYYNLSCAANYIRTDRIKKDIKWKVGSSYGDIDISINLSKPEKDPKAIAAAKNAPQSGYPKCLLCAENEGFAGNINKPARQNHRIIPINLNGEKWFLQYSPYVYYTEHCIALCGIHRPMKINKALFLKMMDFITLFPHYFIGSNADLPIVGGSILSHDHMQGGKYSFAMEKAKIIREVRFTGFENVKAGIVNWPLSVLRLRSSDKEAIISLADKILTAWRG